MVDVTARYRALPDRLESEEYNYEHFRTAHLINDLRRTVAVRGVLPGQPAPDFELPLADGGSVRLQDLRGKPVLLRFASFTCPVANGSVEPLKRLHEKWGDQVRFLEVLIRQAHPGPGVEAYDSLDRKMEDARRYIQEDEIPWAVAVDDVPGRAHQVYGTLSDPAYLIDSAGRIAFYSLWTNPPALNRAIEQLLAQDGRGIVGDGIERRPRLLPMLAHGWRGIQRGLPQSYIDLETAMPGSGTILWLGWLARPWLEERANRIEEPPPRPARERAAEVLPTAALAAGAVAGAVFAVVLFQRLRA